MLITKINQLQEGDLVDIKIVNRWYSGIINTVLNENFRTIRFSINRILEVWNNDLKNITILKYSYSLKCGLCKGLKWRCGCPLCNDSGITPNNCTCLRCFGNIFCKYSFDPYNTNEDCLASK